LFAIDMNMVYKSQKVFLNAFKLGGLKGYLDEEEYFERLDKFMIFLLSGSG
jgi:hypothetical protein